MTQSQARSAYQRVTDEASRLYVPGAPTKAWREACRRADEAWTKLLAERKIKR